MTKRISYNVRGDHGLGYIYVDAVFYNPIDYTEFVEGRRRFEDVRRATLKSLIDTGATFPALPEDVVEMLSLPIYGEAEAETATGREKVRLALAIIQIEDRTAASYVIVRPRGTTPLVGVVALEQMGFRVDPVTGKLIKGLPLMLLERTKSGSVV
jgi:predicted aspartyl protease